MTRIPRGFGMLATPDRRTPPSESSELWQGVLAPYHLGTFVERVPTLFNPPLSPLQTPPQRYHHHYQQRRCSSHCRLAVVSVDVHAAKLLEERARQEEEPCIGDRVTSARRSRVLSDSPAAVSLRA
ncbi:hypothetical protein KPH14_009430 [Odynerus spinipes]|uniref:Uncharacterized protein n=1 Tax=Odynerus spinipes TaxID=1348599 RepID=A0AAD9VRH5_9HYME|nr:hypothetical protein KPH14_009430 [Odynerus spinipes]